MTKREVAAALLKLNDELDVVRKDMLKLAEKMKRLANPKRRGGKIK